jgi:hypothetical protein
MENTSHLRDEELDGWRDKVTTPNLMATFRSLKENNERLMRAQAKKEKLNAVLLKSLLEIQKKL